MMTLLRGLHAIAAPRGDGLRPEFFRAFAQSPALPEVQRMDGARAIEAIDAISTADLAKHARCAEIVVMLRKKRG